MAKMLKRKPAGVGGWDGGPSDKMEAGHFGGGGGGKVLTFPDVNDTRVLHNLIAESAAKGAAINKGFNAVAGTLLGATGIPAANEIADDLRARSEKAAIKEQAAAQEKEYVKRQGGAGKLLLKRIAKAKKEQK